jgi:hypothetical protein
LTIVEEPPWKRRLQRLKEGIDPDGPLSEDEAKEQDRWDGYVEADKKSACQKCHEKGTLEVDKDEDCSPLYYVYEEEKIVD